MNPRRKKRLTIILAISAGLAAVIGLVLYALSQNIDLFYTPSELVEGKARTRSPEEGQRLRIGGLVVPGSVQGSPEPQGGLQAGGQRRASGDRRV